MPLPISDSSTARVRKLFPGFSAHDICADGGPVRTLTGGAGRPLLLLHGYPQTSAMWHRIASHLARVFTVVIPDLRGYGHSWKPESTADHAPYTKRVIAHELVKVMQSLGMAKFSVVAHDRGARVAHRMALDWPTALDRLTLIDIVPTAVMYRDLDGRLAPALYHWFLATQPFPFPERLIGASADVYREAMLFGKSQQSQAFSEEALAEYRDCFTEQMIHASCEDYRAAASTDLVHDAADGDRKIECPLQVLWGKHSSVGRFFDALAIWQARATNASGRGFDCGHFVPEELPNELLRELLAFHQADGMPGP